MGLDVSVKGLSREETYHGGYMRFTAYRQEIASLYNKRLGELYEKYIRNTITIFENEKLTEEEIEEWNNICNNDLDIFLFHNDCDGKFTPQECKKIYKVLEKINIETEPFNNLHQLWLNMFKYCYKKRVNMYFY